jgi:subtilase family serine protease
MKKIKLVAILLICILFSISFNNNVNNSQNQIVIPLIQTNDSNNSSANIGYTPTQIKQAYDMSNITPTGKGQTIALIISYGDSNIQNDVKIFDAKYNLPNANISIINLNKNTTNINMSNWSIETSVDTEWSHAMAPDAHIMIVEADNTLDSLLNAVDYAVKNGANIVSMSWGTDEFAQDIQYDYHFSNPNVIFLSTSGDGNGIPQYPATANNVISVGGTTLSINSNNKYEESTWQYSFGGQSAYEIEPSWQTTFNFKISGNYRKSPDVSFDANTSTGVNVYNSNKWYVAGGTSLGVPAWAGIIADINQNGHFIKNAGSLYDLAGKTSYTNSNKCFNDITIGQDNNGYKAQIGWDLITGLGTPNVDNIILQE